LAVNYTQYTGQGVTALHPGVARKVNGQPTFTGKLTVARRSHELWDWPLRWPGAEHPQLGAGQPSLIFTGDMTDIFVEGRSVMIINRICATLAASKHIGLLVTKRTPQMANFFTALDPRTARYWQPKLWLGFSAERQDYFDARWADMRPLADAGWTVFVSIAPMLRAVMLPSDFLTLAKWVIVAGEQGAHRDCRYMNPNWARAVRDQCRSAGIPFFMKQMSKKRPRPPDLQIQEFPPLPVALVDD
jgi:protein gp37